jgi:hypothetical protein
MEKGLPHDFYLVGIRQFLSATTLHHFSRFAEHGSGLLDVYGLPDDPHVERMRPARKSRLGGRRHRDRDLIRSWGISRMLPVAALTNPNAVLRYRPKL